MGKAAEWFGVGDRERIALEILVDAKVHGGKVAAHCPFHSERTPGGAFFYDASEDCGHCHSCGQASDLIGVYCALNGRSFEDTNGFIEFRDRFAPEQAGKPVNPRRAARPKAQPRGWEPEARGLPPEKWREKAGKFADECAKRLEETPDVQEQLAAWGIPMDVARACRIGWNPSDTFRPVSSWGLPKEIGKSGRESKIWIPGGLVLPFAAAGEVIKLRIRRPNPEAGPDWAKGRRYHAVAGSSKRVSLYGDPAWKVWVLVESDRDAAMVWGFGRRLKVGAVGLASVSARPDAEAAAVLRRADLILNALDLDDAGATHTHKFWEKEFPNVRRWPVSPRFGKDPGDAVKAGMDIREWLLAGMPSFVRREAEKAERRPVRTGEPMSPAPKSEPAAVSTESPVLPPEKSQEQPADGPVSTVLPGWMEPVTASDLEALGQPGELLREMCSLLEAFRARPAVLCRPDGDRGVVLWVPDSAWFAGADPAAFERLRELYFDACAGEWLALALPNELRASRGLQGCHGQRDRDGEWAMLVKNEGGLSCVGWRRLDHWFG